MSTATRPEMSINFASPEVNREPFSILAAVREEAPAVWNPLINHWMVGGFDDIRALLADETHFKSDSKFFDDIFGARIMGADDDPRHNETRAVWNPSFRRPTVQGKYREMIERVVDECLADVIAGLRAGETIEIVSKFSNVIPSVVISEMLGVQREDIPKFVKWSQDMGLIAESAVEPTPERRAELMAIGMRAQQAMTDYAGEELERRRREERDDDLIGMMALAPIAAERSEAELRAGVSNLVMGGHETTGKLIGHMMIIFSRHRDQLEAIREDRGLIPQAVEEVIRYAGVIGAIVREARTDGDIQGIPVTQGELILNLPTAANRDPRRWADPDTFDIFRERKQHVGFGYGTHSCIGQNLARFEAHTVLDRLLTEVPDYKITNESFDYGTNWFLRGPQQILVKL
jgi:cytochrome P450